jgi:hypothetical protein
MQAGEQNGDPGAGAPGEEPAGPPEVVLEVPADGDLSSVGIHLGSTIQTDSELTPVIPLRVGRGGGGGSGAPHRGGGGGDARRSASTATRDSRERRDDAAMPPGHNGDVGVAAAAAAKAAAAGLPHFEAARIASGSGAATPPPPAGGACMGKVRGRRREGERGWGGAGWGGGGGAAPVAAVAATRAAVTERRRHARVPPHALGALHAWQPRLLAVTPWWSACACLGLQGWPRPCMRPTPRAAAAPFRLPSQDFLRNARERPLSVLLPPLLAFCVLCALGVLGVVLGADKYEAETRSRAASAALDWVREGRGDSGGGRPQRWGAGGAGAPATAAVGHALLPLRGRCCGSGHAC